MFYSYSLCVCVCVFFATLFLTSRFPLFPQPLSVSASPNSFVFFPPLVNSSLLTVMFGSKFGQRLGRPLEWRLGGVWVCVWVEIGLCLGGWMKSGCARCGFGICSPWVWVLLIVGFIFIFYYTIFFLNILYALGFFFTYKFFVWSPNYNSYILVKPNLISIFNFIFEISFWHALH